MSNTLHSLNTTYNSAMAKCRTKTNKNRWKHSPNKRGFTCVTADEVLEKLLELGIKRNKRTLQRYAKQGLITPPKTKSLGRNVGRVSEYGDSSPYEFFASWRLLNGLGCSSEKIKYIRELATLVICTKVLEVEHVKKEYKELEDDPLNADIIKEQIHYVIRSNDFFFPMAEYFFKVRPEVKNFFSDPNELGQYAALWTMLTCDEKRNEMADDLFEKNNNSILEEIAKSVNKYKLDDILNTE